MKERPDSAHIGGKQVTLDPPMQANLIWADKWLGIPRRVVWGEMAKVIAINDYRSYELLNLHSRRGENIARRAL